MNVLKENKILSSKNLIPKLKITSSKNHVLFQNQEAKQILLKYCKQLTTFFH